MNGIIKCPKCGRNMMVSKQVNEDNTQDVSCLNCGFRTKKQVLGGTTMKAKIDLEKFICSLMKRFYETHNIDPITTECWLDKVLKDQGLEYKDGEIVEIPQESKDERIRKAISQCVEDMRGQFEKLYSVHHKDAIAWLEKQGGQKLIDKVKPKFKVGDWVILAENHNSVYQVEIIDNNRYYLRHYLGGALSVRFDNELIRQWAIQDAKDGDVLVYNNSLVEIILLFKKWKEGIGDGAYSYVHIFDNKILFDNWSDCGYSAHPATKEQRDTLFAKMKEAGYEWDEEKKELRRLEKQGQVKDSAISQHENKTCKENSNSLTGFKLPIKWTQDNIDDLTEFEAAMMHVGESFFGEYAGLNPNDTMSVKVEAKLLLELAPKPKWTKEDENMVKSIMDYLSPMPIFFVSCNGKSGKEYTEDFIKQSIKWLETIKQRMEEH